ncbi:DUF3127 domain-containing protein [Flavobacterium sp. HSC-61S13]|uniref:DUF3127 domain-containing protein n=1 Tax=Flavobacterium sp. HSC-61S13 TaxID=2910963 RepID=UPI00209FA3B8|nr:DUF3127 domain-containing protein [Flavobacterium sp. HSC-61S13]MCP1996626.1 hypothetical protein [Flavobacterium sp. HSC-61S13]
MHVIGRIKAIHQSQQVSQSFTKRELVVTTEEQYPQHIIIEFTQDRCDLLDSFQIGQPVKVSINLRGREWVNPQGETKYFNSIQGWKIDAENSAPRYDPVPESAVDNYMGNKPQFNEEEHDDLPF